MLEQKLVFGKDWTSEDEVIVYEPTYFAPYWKIEINYKDAEKIKILTSNAIVIYENEQVVEIRY